MTTTYEHTARVGATSPDTAASDTAASDTAATVRDILAVLFGPPNQRDFAVRFWDGSLDAPAPGTRSRFTLVLRRPGALRRALLPPSELALGEAYLRDDFDVEGDLERAVGLGDVLAARLRSPLAVAHLVADLLRLRSDDAGYEDLREAAGLPALPAHSRERDAAAVRFHYDVGNDFYALWLDPRMVYSCAYFRTGTEDLATAQQAKLDLICRKLRLQPGERLLDIGSGWGGLLLYAAEHYGVDATGITLSEAQATLARERIAAAGLADRCRVEVRDYRTLPAHAAYDKIASVGMVEHVGRDHLPAYFEAAYRALRPGGLFLNHGIVLAPPSGARPGLFRRLAWREGAFIQRYVFPDGELLTPPDNLKASEGAGFEVRDVENLREHYALTLRHWIRNLEAHHADAVDLVGEPTYRTWRLYMAGSARAFASGQIGVVQTLLARTRAAGLVDLPLTREDVYRDAA